MKTHGSEGEFSPAPAPPEASRVLPSARQRTWPQPRGSRRRCFCGNSTAAEPQISGQEPNNSDFMWFHVISPFFNIYFEFVPEWNDCAAEIKIGARYSGGQLQDKTCVHKQEDSCWSRCNVVERTCQLLWAKHGSTSTSQCIFHGWLLTEWKYEGTVHRPINWRAKNDCHVWGYKSVNALSYPHSIIWSGGHHTSFISTLIDCGPVPTIIARLCHQCFLVLGQEL